MTDKHETTPPLRWHQHDSTFASLMLGRVEVAQISKGTATDAWFYTLRFCVEGERPCFSEATEAAARSVAEAHAAKVMA